ncbi:hypothetical protein [Peribacillus simplex]|uniref:Uncharacterized protein n=1 Tax=Peribacillus simplex TaxID=1478 RepID=A0A9W4KVP6_9BACI|nr:hypothetical protein [Peribacillus simplex]CAH0235496.1 hypothetical protein SRABI133_02750 [Peribacillus simplex]
MPDAVAMGVVLWDDIVLEDKFCYSYVCTTEEAPCGQVIINDGSKLAISDGFGSNHPNTTSVRPLTIRYSKIVIRIIGKLKS